MNTETLQDMINSIVIAETETFYKKWIVKRGNQNYYDVESYFKKYSNEKFETTWAYKQYQEWLNSDVYTKDIAYIENEYWFDILDGFDSRMEEFISMTDDDDDEREMWIKMRDGFANIKTRREKMEFLSKEYLNNYFPNDFDYRFLYNYYENQLFNL